MNEQHLRQALDEIDGQTYEDAAMHPALIARLYDKFHHSIVHIPDDSDLRERDCYSFAFNLAPRLIWATDAFPEIYKDFIQHRLVPSLQEVPEHKASVDILVLYLIDGQPKHAGILKSDRVISKWGANPVYEHGKMEVPARHGNDLRYYLRPDSHETTEAFIEYVRNHERYVDVHGLFEDEVSFYLQGQQKEAKPKASE